MSTANALRRGPAIAAHQPEDRIFPTLPPGHPVSVRRREVQRFRDGGGTHGRRAWNPSVKDEQHPFPQPALNNTTTCYNGVDVVATHFPETVRGTAYLRAQGAVQPVVWTKNRTRASASMARHTYRCDALENHEAPLSYLATVIRDGSDPAKRKRQEGWCASTTLEGFRGNRHVAPAAEDTSHAPAHKELTATLTASCNGGGGYVSPYNHVKEMNASYKAEKELQQQAAAESLVGFYAARPGPPVFKMSNADAWWDMDPVAVTRDMTERADAMKANPYSTTFRRSDAPATAAVPSSTASSRKMAWRA
ncbi:hypothetical protein NESM_000565400 [Novymonas esmeraldas]|uniref:Flagellar associated protein n=1 Tax=Novymonas esmeraldas TaxID=1808958 RepID=A0AAW0EU72_9TRYP